MKNVIIAGDHSSLELKERLKSYLEAQGYRPQDLGVHSTDSVDYPDIAQEACTSYLKAPENYAFGILICGTGIGISIAANKIDGIRCALPQNCFAGQMAKEHNNANFISFGARIDYQESPEQILAAYLAASFAQGGRHQQRIDKIHGLER